MIPPLSSDEPCPIPPAPPLSASERASALVPVPLVVMNVFPRFSRSGSRARAQGGCSVYPRSIGLLPKEWPLLLMSSVPSDELEANVRTRVSQFLRAHAHEQLTTNATRTILKEQAKKRGISMAKVYHMSRVSLDMSWALRQAAVYLDQHPYTPGDAFGEYVLYLEDDAVLDPSQERVKEWLQLFHHRFGQLTDWSFGLLYHLSRQYRDNGDLLRIAYNGQFTVALLFPRREVARISDCMLQTYYKAPADVLLKRCTDPVPAIMSCPIIFRHRGSTCTTHPGIR